MAETRWDRLAADLKAAGFEITVDARAYQGDRPGKGGITRSITLLVPGKGLVQISDAWWRKNPEIWIGWEVSASNADDIVITGRPKLSKKRSETVAAFKAALARLEG